MGSLEQLFIDERATIRSALELLDSTAKRILLIAPEGHLKAVITDGDIRRHLIRNGASKTRYLLSLHTIPSLSPGKPGYGQSHHA